MQMAAQDRELVKKQIKARSQMKPRQIALALHSVLGLTFGLYLFVMSVSGTAIVFSDELTEFFTRDQYSKSQITQANAAGQVKPDSLSATIRDVKIALPDYKPTFISGLDGATAAPLVVYLSAEEKPQAEAKKKESRVVYLDRATHAVTGDHTPPAIITFLKDLHYNLLLGKTGRMLNGWGGVLLLVMCVTGVMLWWKSKLGSPQWRRQLVVVRDKKGVNLPSLHGAVGIWLLPMLVMFAVSGMYFGFPEQTRAILGLGPKGTGQAGSVKTLKTGASGGAPVKNTFSDVDLDKLEATACTLATNLSPLPVRLSQVSLSGKKNRAVRFWYRNQSAKIPAEVWLDADDGHVLSATGPLNVSDREGILIWLVRLHFGTFAGLGSKIAWTLTGWLPALLYMTGVIMWRKRRSR